MGAIRRADGFTRYALAIQYNGASFFGFVRQPRLKRAVGIQLSEKVAAFHPKLPRVRTVEGCIRDALSKLVGEENFENLQVSSRTDRGVHAIKNTMHVDIRPRHLKSDPWETKNLHRGLNFCLAQTAKSTMCEFVNQAVTILAVRNAPQSMKNVFFNGSEQNGPEEIDWNARFSATSRTYMYRILESDNTFAAPFQWDRSWMVGNENPLNVHAMQEAAKYMLGTHNVSSFRGPTCKPVSPITTLDHFSVTAYPFGCETEMGMIGSAVVPSSAVETTQRLVLIKVAGNRFVYRQVRNMVGCLVAVGQGKLEPMDAKKILEAQDRGSAPAMAPASGLFLVNVEHGDFKI